ncbi:MAG: hypothetical protein A2289_22305 [Deltaproteobacteria bacterium RIFOXYA12_FULL_58_15]|nr:MAG: hypothetical protein A2289_22305 [Deltaproteobacteria bacterium RIFOXYA12_FULL_58_15]
MKLLTLAVVSLALSVVACGEPLTKAEAKKAWPGTAGLADSSDNGASSLTASISRSLDCPKGGDMDATASVSSNLRSADFDFGFELELNDCTVQVGEFDAQGAYSLTDSEMTLDGDMEWAFGYEDNGDGSFELSWSYTGDVSYSGVVEGDCEFELTASMTSNANSSDPLAIEVKYDGDICGYQASEVLTYNE